MLRIQMHPTVHCGPRRHGGMRYDCTSANPRRALRKGQAGKVAGLLRRRAGAPHEARAPAIPAPLPWDRGVGDWRFQQCAQREDQQQIKSKKLETNMAFFQTVQDFVQWKKEGVLDRRSSPTASIR